MKLVMKSNFANGFSKWPSKIKFAKIKYIAKKVGSGANEVTPREYVVRECTIASKIFGCPISTKAQNSHNRLKNKN